MLRSLLIFTVLALTLASAHDLPQQDWQKIRDAQPAGLSVDMSLPKTRYHVGELISATVVFANTSQDEYHLWSGSYDRSGRIEDIRFLAVGPDGKTVEDPWENKVRVGGGLGGYADLGEWSIDLPVNQYLWLDQPGTYQVYAWTSRVIKGPRMSGLSKSEPQRVTLVSDSVTITLDPLDPAREAEIIAQAQASLAGDDGKSKRAAADALCYLRTPASRQALVPHIGKPYAFAAYHALESAPDPAVEAARILKAVQEGVLVANGPVLTFYAQLKEPRKSREVSHPEPHEEFVERQKRAMDELTAAAKGAPHQDPSDAYESLLANLFRQPDQRAKFRAELVKVQLKLSPKQAEQVLSGWNTWGGDDFLPLAEKMVAAPHHQDEALRAIASSRPELARKIILEDLQRERPPFDKRSLLSLPSGEIVEFQSFFAAELSKKETRNTFHLFEAINRYGGAALLPPVIRIYTAKEGTWACDIAASSLQFWVRHDPENGLAALERALTLREKTRCYTSVLDRVLLEQWTPASQPLLTRALEDSQPEVVASAIKVLERHTGQQLLEPCIRALEELPARVTSEDLKSLRYAQYAASALLRSERWQLDAAQKQRLEKVLVAAQE